MLLGPRSGEAMHVVDLPCMPRTEGDWYLALGRGLLHLGRREHAKAHSIAKQGLACPFAALRERFSTLRGLAELHLGRQAEAERILVERAALEPTRVLCFAEALARRGAREPARRALESFEGQVVELKVYRDLLARRFGLAGEKPDPAIDANVIEASCEALAA